MQSPSIRQLKTRKKQSYCIGIITMPHRMKTKYGQTHIMKTYIDWFEERGVRVIAIPYDTTEYELYFNSINGLLIPGGETKYVFKNKTFVKTCSNFIQLSIQQKCYFPIWGTCFGFQLITHIIGKFNSFKKSPAQGHYPLHITPYGYKSRMLSHFSKSYLEYLEKKDSTLHNKDYGITPSDFTENKLLNSFFNIIGISTDDKGQEFVSAIEGKHYPIYGVQWHPERQESGGPFADFLISELKRNSNSCKILPRSIRSTLTPKKCIQYPELTKYKCYFF
jgi:gamma-glutamyl hydrolase